MEVTGEVTDGEEEEAIGVDEGIETGRKITTGQRGHAAKNATRTRKSALCKLFSKQYISRVVLQNDM